VPYSTFHFFFSPSPPFKEQPEFNRPSESRPPPLRGLESVDFYRPFPRGRSSPVPYGFRALVKIPCQKRSNVPPTPAAPHHAGQANKHLARTRRQKFPIRRPRIRSSNTHASTWIPGRTHPPLNWGPKAGVPARLSPMGIICLAPVMNVDHGFFVFELALTALRPSLFCPAGLVPVRSSRSAVFSTPRSRGTRFCYAGLLDCPQEVFVLRAKVHKIPQVFSSYFPLSPPAPVRRYFFLPIDSLFGPRRLIPRHRSIPPGRF